MLLIIRTNSDVNCKHPNMGNKPYPHRLKNKETFFLVLHFCEEKKNTHTAHDRTYFSFSF